MTHIAPCFSSHPRSIALAGSAVVVAVASCLGAAPAIASTQRSAVTVIATGLNNPRGLAWGADGQLYVAEAGSGGTACFNTPRGKQCAGTSSAITKVSGGDVDRRVTGLISVANPDGTFATGADGLSLRDDGGLYTIITASPQQIPPGLPPKVAQAAYDQLGQLMLVTPSSGRFQTLAGVGAYDWAWADQHRSINPQYPDANPYGVLALENTTYVVDAASNTLDRVDSHGHVTIVALFPNPPVSDAVPTCVANGPDGALYVGELTGFGNAPGAAVVWRVVPGQKPVAWQTGLTAITGCGFDDDGNFYATEFQTGGLGSSSPAGDVVRISKAGTRTHLGVGQVFLPNGFLAGPDDTIYVSNWSAMTGTSSHGSPTGEVIRLSV